MSIMRLSEYLAVGAENKAVILALVLTVGASSILPAQGGEAKSPKGQVLAHVFHHICENSRLGAILRLHHIQDVCDGKTERRTVCAVGDFPIQSGDIYFELYPASGADELWVADESGVLQADSKPTIVLRLCRTEEVLIVDRAAADPVRLPRERDSEDRLTLRVSNGNMVLFDERRNGRPILSEPISIRSGVQLLIPSEGQSCGPEECGLPALCLYLDPTDTGRWTKAGLPRTEGWE